MKLLRQLRANQLSCSHINQHSHVPHNLLCNLYKVWRKSRMMNANWGALRDFPALDPQHASC